MAVAHIKLHISSFLTQTMLRQLKITSGAISNGSRETQNAHKNTDTDGCNFGIVESTSSN